MAVWSHPSHHDNITKPFFQNGSHPVPREKMATQRYQEESWGWGDGSVVTELAAQT